ncbi:hypothetical protein [Streptomyces sp. CBMA156]|uniref:hypothetical protein n=1 Tax=Streptomyces sp. CBMA156 TaxID=1930280 RepID=UPI001661918F|nr:hypothetical protein [Streptomyces sp. CBMA156]
MSDQQNTTETATQTTDNSISGTVTGGTVVQAGNITASNSNINIGGTIVGGQSIVNNRS